MKLRDSALYRIAKQTPLLQTLVFEELDYICESVLENSYKRHPHHGDATRVYIFVSKTDNYARSKVFATSLDERLDTEFKVDGMVEAALLTFENTSDYAIDEAVTKSLWSSTIMFGDGTFGEQDADKQSFWLTAVASLLVTALDDPSDVFVFCKPHLDEKVTTPTVDHIWYKQR